jgi:hypothetical protein
VSWYALLGLLACLVGVVVLLLASGPSPVLTADEMSVFLKNLTRQAVDFECGGASSSSLPVPPSLVNETFPDGFVSENGMARATNVVLPLLCRTRKAVRSMVLAALPFVALLALSLGIVVWLVRGKEQERENAQFAQQATKENT